MTNPATRKADPPVLGTPAGLAHGRSDEPRFTQGSIMRHVVDMTATGSVGLMAIFAVDLLSLLYVSWLGRAALTAGVGFATVVLFFAVSVNIGLMIAVSALVSRALGARDRERARRQAASSLVHMGIVAAVVSIVAMPLLPAILSSLGAEGEAHAVARRFLLMVLPSNVLMAFGMAMSGILRAVGDARRAMYVTLAGGVATAGLDPLLIFGFGLGVDGAAIALVLSRVVFCLVGFHGAVVVHRLVGRPGLAAVKADFAPMLAIAGPAILSNVASPVANAFVAATMARFGEAAIAATAIIDRLVPVAFGVLFALAGAVGPILGQNLGAKRFDRLGATLTRSMIFMTLYVAAVWAVLALLRHQVAMIFNLDGMTAEIVMFFCLVSGLIWFFIGMLFVANAAFNNLGFPLYSTAFNWGRATLGTVPFVMLGARWAGAEGTYVGLAAGAAIFGTAALWTAYRAVGRLAARG